jgi:hypothetical protein
VTIIGTFSEGITIPNQELLYVSAGAVTLNKEMQIKYTNPSNNSRNNTLKFKCLLTGKWLWVIDSYIVGHY